MTKQVDMWPEDKATYKEEIALASIKGIRKNTKYKQHPTKSSSAKKTIKSRMPRGKKKPKKSVRPFWIGLTILAGLIVIVLYVEFFMEKRRVTWPEGFSVYGIDVSHHQKEVDWFKIKTGEVSFAFMKATEGITLKDRQFERNWQAASDAAIIRGAYHFYLPYLSPEKQAEHFIRTVKLHPGDLPPVLDVEVKGRKSKEQLQKDVKVWLRIVENAYAAKPIIYTGYTFYKDYLAGEFDDYPLWIAHYKVDKLKIEKDYKTKLAFWQHTDNGVVDGIERGVDCNVFYGTMRDLKSLCIQPESIK